MRRRVLVIDDDAQARALVAEVLGTAGYRVRAISRESRQVGFTRAVFERHSIV